MQERFVIRLPDGMRDRIADAAKANNRSMNAEIVSRLERSFEGAQLGFSADLLDVLGLQATLTLTLAATIDRSKLTEGDLMILDSLTKVSKRVTDRLHVQDGFPQFTTKGEQSEN